MTGIEIDLVVPDCKQALALYEQVFTTENAQVSSLPDETYEATFSIHGTRFRLVDENEDFQLLSPRPGDGIPMWCTVYVPDAEVTFAKAIQAGCIEVDPVEEHRERNQLRAIFIDPFGYMWTLCQIIG